MDGTPGEDAEDGKGFFRVLFEVTADRLTT